MKAFRKILFWLHLSAGVFAGVVVLIMSVTGVLLTYEKQMLAWADLRHFRSAPSPGARRVPIDALLAKVREEKGSLPATVTLRSHPSDPVAFVFGRESTVYANPYTGELLGEGSAGLRSFFRVVTDWHRWLGAGTEGRATGKAITGACNLAFLFIVCSGLYLCWPRNWTWPSVRSVILFRGGLSGKARDFNWHNTFGFWCCVPLFFIVLGGTVISYSWASNLVYRAVGEDPPARRGPGPGAAGPGGPREPGSRRGGSEDGQQRPEGNRGRDRETGPESGTPAAVAGSQPKAASAEELPAGQVRAEAAPAPGQRGENSREGQARKDRRGEGPRSERPDREGRRGPGARDRGPAGLPEPPADLNLAGFDKLLAQAEQHVTVWKTISLRLPASNDAPVSFLIDQGMGGQPHLRSTLTLNRQTAEVAKWETFSDGSRGQRLRSLLRFIHTGVAGGFTGQTIAGVVSLGACFLVWTGLALTWRRFRAWIGRRSQARDVAMAPQPDPATPQNRAEARRVPALNGR